MSTEPVSGAPSHLDDETLLLLVDDELPAADRQRASAHMNHCPECAARVATLRRVSRDLASAYTVEARHVRAAKVCAALVTAACSFYWLAANGVPRSEPTVASLQMSILPMAYLTPGATRTATAAELCSSTRDDEGRSISPSIRRAVLRNYGVRSLSEGDYELDYLITPELGGAADPQNLWPERYASATWNAHVKDDLEQLLRRLVCSGSVPLASAQRDIATNWVSAYKRYFHADKPGGWAATLPQPVPIRE